MSEDSAVKDREPKPGTESFIVVHTNSSGHPFATRVTAKNYEAAHNAVLKAHADNVIHEVLADHGEAEHGYGGTTLLVNTLDQEP